MISAREQLLAELAARIQQIAPQEARVRQMLGALIIDVREDGERASGRVEGAVGVAPQSLEARINAIAPDKNTPILTLCGGGTRSLLAADTLHQLGYANVASISGGITRWRAENLPVHFDQFDSDAAERYSRHLLLPEVGAEGQARLNDSCIALIGAGGLGSPAALYLAAAGVGGLTLIDDDVVEKSNLQRQVLHTDARVGMAKTESALIALTNLNPRVHVQPQTKRLRAANVEGLIRDHDVVIDGADNFPTRYLLNAACLRLKIPLVYGAVHRFTGQISVFDARRTDSPCYRCLFPEPPAAGEVQNCAEAGVLGVLPGIIGLMQALEAVKLIVGIGSPLVGRLLCFDALAARFRELRLPRDAQCPGCGEHVEFTGYEDVARICAR